MPKKPITERPCKECKKVIPYISCRVYCLDCYKIKKPFNDTNQIKFISDDEI